MSSGGAGLEAIEAGRADFPSIDYTVSDGNTTPRESLKPASSSSDRISENTVGPAGEIYPTKEELKTLRKVKGKIDWVIYSVGFIEMVERFAYYGTTAVFVNFIQWPLPEGSNTGAAGTYGQPGALGLGQRASTGLTLFNAFWSYLMPLLGGYIADAHLGRFATISWAIVIATIGHIIIIIAAIPQVITNPQASLACFVVGLIFFGIGVGWFKCNVSPLIAENYSARHPHPYISTLSTGERVIVDPHTTISVIYMRFYWLINVGALLGQISMVYAEKYVGFWLSYTLPTILFLACPFVMYACRNKYVHRPPTGSVLTSSLSLFRHASKGQISWNPVRTARNFRSESFWNSVRPSTYTNNAVSKPTWITWDDAWVDEVRRGLEACKVFVWYPIFWLAYSQMTNNLVSQAATMELGGVPNDIIHNLNPLSLLILIPIFDKGIYPALARFGVRFTPIRKITCGFAMGALSMVIAALIQHYIYQQSPCGNQASSCAAEGISAPISVWVQTPAFVIIAMSEIFASITGLEYAFTKAPANMRGLVTGLFFFANAFSSALGQAFTGLSEDPLLVWLYVAVAVISALGGIGFWITFRGLDKREEELNALPESEYKGDNGVVDEEKKI